MFTLTSRGYLISLVYMATKSSRQKGPGLTRGEKAASKDELEKQLLDTVKRYELIFKATNDVLYDLDMLEGTVIWNEALYSQYGYGKNEDVSTLEWWTSHIHPDDALRLEHELSNWFEGGHDTWQAEYRFRKADGSYIYVRDRGVVHRAEDGTPLRIIGSFLDITQQKQLDRAKTEFISLVSHQLRTPLTVIRINSEMLNGGLLGTLSAEQETYAKEISEASSRLIKLVSDILNISRVELGHIIAKPVPTNVNKRLQACIKEVSPLAQKRGVTITYQPDNTVKRVSVDTTIFDEVVHNLLTNAIRYTKSQGGIVDVSFLRTAEGYMLTVADNGIGIPKSAQPNIFGRFYRANNTANIKEHGTGLGLYLVKLMVEAAGGKVWFESAKEKGTTFFVLFPE